MDTKIKAQEQRCVGTVTRLDAVLIVHVCLFVCLCRQAAPAPVGGGGDGAPANCEEYFLIAQTAVKIGLAIKFPHQSDAIFKVRVYVCVCVCV